MDWTGGLMFWFVFKQVAVAQSVELAGGTTAAIISFKLVILSSKYVATIEK